MFRAIFEVSVSAVIVVGTLVGGWMFYHATQAAIFDPSVPHDVLWRTLFGQ